REEPPPPPPPQRAAPQQVAPAWRGLPFGSGGGHDDAFLASAQRLEAQVRELAHQQQSLRSALEQVRMEASSSSHFLETVRSQTGSAVHQSAQPHLAPSLGSPEPGAAPQEEPGRASHLGAPAPRGSQGAQRERWLPAEASGPAPALGPAPRARGAAGEGAPTGPAAPLHAHAHFSQQEPSARSLSAAELAGPPAPPANLGFGRNEATLARWRSQLTGTVSSATTTLRRHKRLSCA
ncbi:unnamed protein product, partial [Prorocentrum cordatum]